MRSLRLFFSIQKMQDEAASSNKRNASIQMKWQALYEKSIPQELLQVWYVYY